MRLVTFENSTRQSRIGALAGNDGRIIDLNSACALYLKDRQNESAFQRIADALVPPNMRALFEGGDTSLDAARKALKHALDRGSNATGVRGEPISYASSETRLKAPIIPKKFFHTAGNFREHHEEATKAGFSHPVMPWIVFFQNVDAIIGHDEPVIYPEHLTHELDYELELTVVLKKSGKHFTPEDAASYIGGYVIFNDITARDIQRREMKSGVFSFCKAIDTFCPLGPGSSLRTKSRTHTTSPCSCASMASRARIRIPAKCPSKFRKSSPITRRWVTAPETSSPPARSLASLLFQATPKPCISNPATSWNAKSKKSAFSAIQ
jgi:2-keto-4-pentenoate hydratase/2-oxohepta-3-ene-1,7-dioic acid hydratase in catechol pathway